MDRRTFLHRSSAAAGSLAIGSALLHTSASAQLPTAPRFPIAVFTKVFQTHSFEQLATAVEQMEVDGIEATIRKGGHIEPEKAAEQVPQMAAALKSKNKSLLIAATDIASAGESEIKLLKTLKQSGTNVFRLSHLKYSGTSSRLQQVRELRSKLLELSQAAKELGMIGVYQNHAGENYVGNVIWDLAEMFDGIDPQVLGIALDLRHMRIEISGSFRSAIEAVRPHIRTVYLKDSQRTGPTPGEVKDVPLGEGLVNKDLFQFVSKNLAPIPVALHVEYFGQKPIEPEKIGPVIEAYRRDAAVLRSWIK